MKMENGLYYDIRHLKDFGEMISKGKVNEWRVFWPDGGEVKICRGYDVVCTIPNHDVQLATYICSLHNTSARIINEVETKYGVV
jgi:hypothetical protein